MLCDVEFSIFYIIRMFIKIIEYLVIINIYKKMTSNEKDGKNFAKILLMGKAGVGKTSMRSIIFANQAPKDTFFLLSTSEVAETRLKFMGNLIFNLFDCGGQEEFIEQYFQTKKEKIFSKVEVLIFVIEAENFKNQKDEDNIEDITYFEK